MLEKIMIFIVFLFPIIFFHELGHYIFARIFGVRVEVFSLGFGPKILKFVRGGTEYALSLIPLGGYIKMFGDDPTKKDEISPKERRYAFNYKGKWARFWIVFGGPLLNFIFAYWIFYALLLSGEKVPEARFGYIQESSAYYKMGVRSGDLINSINDEKIHGATDLGGIEHYDKLTHMTVLRGNEVKHIAFMDHVTPRSFLIKFFGEISRSRRPFLKDTEGNTWIVTNRSGSVVSDMSLEEILQRSYGQNIYLYSYKFTPGKKITNELIDYSKEKVIQNPHRGLGQSFKLLASHSYYPLDLFVKSIVMNSPADKGGLKGGDLITQVDGTALFSFSELRSKIQETAKAKKDVRVTFLRGNENFEVVITPEMKKANGESAFMIGVYSGGDFVPVKFVDTPRKGIFEGLWLAWSKTWDSTFKVLAGYKKLILQEVSLKNVGGPLAIGKVASDSFEISLSYFFKLMALVSINLGVINLFPIPVLDGGHILFIGLEILNRGALSRKKIEMAHQFGLTVLLFLLVAALYNDISRLFS